jgi:hypothetical protein
LHPNSKKYSLKRPLIPGEEIVKDESAVEVISGGIKILVILELRLTVQVVHP